MKEQAERKITACIQEQLGDTHTCLPITLTFTWYEENRRRDLDNIAFAKKFILDALVKNHTIAGDGWKYVRGYSDCFHVDSDNPRIEVKISEVTDDTECI